jgi:hypothetical protein
MFTYLNDKVYGLWAQGEVTASREEALRDGLMFDALMAVFGNCGQAYYQQESHNQRYKNKSVIHSSSSERSQSPSVKHSEVIIKPANITKGFIFPANEGKKYPNTIAVNTSLPISIQISDSFLRWALLNFLISEVDYHANFGVSSRFFIARGSRRNKRRA